MRNTVVSLLFAVVLALYGVGCTDDTVEPLPTPEDGGALVDGSDAHAPNDGATDTGTTTDSGPQPDGSTAAYSVGGTVSGLTGTGLVLDNGGDALSVAANGAFTFPKKLATGASYAVTVKTQPGTPKQTCAVTNGAGTIGAANVTSVTVACTTDAFTVGGTVTGLSGTGLVLQDNAKDDLAVSANGTFTFATKIASGAAFAVTVKTQPSNPSQSCTVSGGAGSVAGGNVTSVTVNCASNKFTVGGTVSGLVGSVVLQNNAGDDLPVSANGTFAFATTVASGQAYAVTVKTQPATETCTVASGSGTVGAVNVTSVAVTCVTNTFTVGGTVSGLVGSVVLRDNGGDDLTVAADGSFTFATKVATGQPYSVTVLTQPATQTCTVTNGSGTIAGAAVTSVAVSCAVNTFTVGGSVSALTGTLVLQDNGGDDLTITANGAFTFATKIATGQAYAVTVKTQPSGQSCSISSGSGTVTSANVTGVVVNCSATQFTVGGSVTGLVGTLVLQNNGGDDATVTAPGSFTFATPIDTGNTYAVSVKTQPANQTCAVTNGSGTMGSGNVTNVTVACATTSFAIGGTISGLVGTVVLQDNGGDDLNVTANGTFKFATTVHTGNGYAVTVKTQPVNQICTVTNGSGTVGAADVTSIAVTCTTATFTVGGTITALNGTVVLQDNGGDDLTLTANGTFTFATKVTAGLTYAVTVKTQPKSQTCAVTNGSGTVNAAVTNVAVACTPPGTSVMVVRVGDGSAPLSNASTATFIEERSVADGSLLRTISLPTSASGGNAALTLGGTSATEGGLSLSADKHFVTLAGYASAPGVASINGTTSAATNRVVGRINAAGQIDTSTLFNAAFSATSIRAATSVDGTSFWASGGNSGLQFITLGSTTATAINTALPTNLRHTHIFDGQLYFTSASGAFQGVATDGVGTPTTGPQTPVALPGFPTTAANPISFAVLDLDTTVGPDTIYLAQDATPGADSINVQKWTLVGATWVQQAFAPALTGATLKITGLAAFVTAAGVRVVASSDEGTTTPSRLVTFVDTGSAPAVTVLATSPTNTAYRGVAFSPAP